MTPASSVAPTHARLPDAGQRSHWEIDAQLPEANEKAALEGTPPTPNEDNPYLTLNALNVAIYQASGTLDLTTTYQDIPGMTTGAFAPTVDEYALVCLVFIVDNVAGIAGGNTEDVLNATLDVNGTDETQDALAEVSQRAATAIAVQWYRIALDAGTEYTLKAHGKNATGNRCQAMTASHMLVWRIPR